METPDKRQLGEGGFIWVHEGVQPIMAGRYDSMQLHGGGICEVRNMGVEKEVLARSRVDHNP